MKFSLPTALLLMASLCSCTTLANRRDMYSPQRVEGPYTRMLDHGIPKTQTTVVEVKESGAGKAYVAPQ